MILIIVERCKVTIIGEAERTRREAGVAYLERKGAGVLESIGDWETGWTTP